MRRVLILVFLSLCITSLHAQLYIGSDPNSLFIKANESLHYEGLTLTPAADFSFSNTTLTKIEAYTISPVLSGNYIKRYFSFSNTTGGFTGTVQFSYAGADLRGSVTNTPIAEADLRLNIFNGNNWSVNTELPDQVNDFVSGSVTAKTLKTLTLAASNGPLPVTWLRFVGERKQHTILLQWSTATEANTKDFVIQHSTAYSGWQTLGITAAAGKSTTRKDYEFTHHSPVVGFNYYRLIQRDQDGSFSYSKVVAISMSAEEVKLKAFPNPVQDGIFYLLLAEAANVNLFDASGRLVYAKWHQAGLQAIDVTRLAAGVYFIRANASSTTITIKR